ncbi:MAG: hypothetical protein ACR2NU_15795 [Aeoliella sp.]
MRFLFIVALCALPGCQSTPWTAASVAGAQNEIDSELNIGPTREGSNVVAPALTELPSDSQILQTTLSNSRGVEPPYPADAAVPMNDAVLRELQTIGAVDPAAAQQLVAQLQTVKPTLRPLAAQQFRSSWQFHRELSAGSIPATGHSHATAEPLIPFVEPAALPLEREGTTTSLGYDPSNYDPSDYDPSNYESPRPTKRIVEESARLPATPIAVTTPTDEDNSQASYTELPRPLPPVDEELPSTTSDDVPIDTWGESVEQAMAQLAAATSDDPHSTSEAYQHARLRMLNIVAGNEVSALEPIPGLTPTEQSYWSNQLFALATLLDHDEQPDDGQRAALASEHLASAVAKLGELSALSVRNLTFCTEVFGYGDYESQEKAVFQPGQSVTLYAEMENFRSESTEKGYHTSLATSYEVLDQNGNRVEGGEFATVDDYCMRQRRDFYIEYTFDLPSRIYANRYQLRLMIRDRLSGKIGKATIDFEIKE